MKIKDLIEELKKVNGNKKLVLVDGNGYEYVIMEVGKSGEVWIENKEEE